MDRNTAASTVNDDDDFAVVVNVVVSPRTRWLTRHHPLPTPVSTRRHLHTQTSGMKMTASDVNDDGDSDDAVTVTRAVDPRTE